MDFFYLRKFSLSGLFWKNKEKVRNYLFSPANYWLFLPAKLTQSLHLRDLSRFSLITFKSPRSSIFQTWFQHENVWKTGNVSNKRNFSLLFLPAFSHSHRSHVFLGKRRCPKILSQLFLCDTAGNTLRLCEMHNVVFSIEMHLRDFFTQLESKQKTPESQYFNLLFPPLFLQTWK